MKDKVTNVLISGVGGQGILLASEVLSEVLMLAGYDVKKNEIHGMAQRGGSVVSHIRFGTKVYSSIIPEGEGDILLGFELLETYRYLPLLRKGAKIIVNDLKILPPPVTLGKETYPDNVQAKIQQAFPDTLLVKGADLAKQVGNPRTVNMALLGAMSGALPIDNQLWTDTLRCMVPERFLEANLEAFTLGSRAALACS
ncbi:indolepyruvate:ferredoxin oxidoreductase, beta subunit [Syntrophotalea carbinolica DSM 2380]|uniref:Indolepyruvate:ferredoxin oxidoreductase, beta subunit n=1 Tax=Syntrophotalea carbinolica (strain DSM 2380 / NBRC 103641 / GraBd1) TaxID=338963 RepID=Q3A494_SYNC1|nr:indolepyruvate oxidoreductase subunit beta [Syntrophotalea carbinolica]ABA88813.1 indolepyruvate:ferredoxin oxidoreductase, beta subunit [Syntrophotalea carbinolica DSM 2380]